MGAISILPCRLWVFFILRFTQIRNHHPYNLALCGPLVRGRRLRLHLKRDPAVRVPQKLLDRLHIFPVGLQQCAEGVAEGTPPGELILSWARKILTERREVFAMARGIYNKQVLPLKLGFSPYVNPLLLQAFRLAYEELFPSCEIQLSGGDTSLRPHIPRTSGRFA